jgi:hypothetical protein
VSPGRAGDDHPSRQRGPDRIPGTGTWLRKDTGISDAPAVLTAAPQQRETLRQALADAVYYRDPPLQCDACPSPERLCDQCTAGHERALAYLALSYQLGLEAPL